MKKQGANKGATTAFLITTPESGVDSITITYALLDPIMTVIRPIAAFVSGIVAGVLENFLVWNKEITPIDLLRPTAVDGKIGESDDETIEKESILSKAKSGLRYGFVEVWGDIVGWFFVGLLIAGLITVLVPDEFMAKWLGGGIVSMLVMLLAGIPLYICATASTPIAAALILKGVSPGAALVFLLVGPATNITSLTVLFGLLGRKSTLRYLLVISTVAVGFGLFTDFFYQILNIEPVAIIGDAAEIVPYSVKLAGTLFLLVLSIKPIMETLKQKFSKQGRPMAIQSSLPNMKDLEQGENGTHEKHSSGCGCK